MLDFTKICLISNLTCQIHKISEFQTLLIATPVWSDIFLVLTARLVQLCHTQTPLPTQQEANIKGHEQLLSAEAF